MLAELFKDETVKQQSRFLLPLIYNNTSRGKLSFEWSAWAKSFGDVSPSSLGTTLQDKITLEQTQTYSTGTSVCVTLCVWVLTALWWVQLSPLSKSSSLPPTISTNHSWPLTPQADPWLWLTALIWSECLWLASTSGFSTLTQNQPTRVVCY